MLVLQKGGFMRTSCYYQYYQEVIAQAEQGNRLFILTGSPGIGKSFFYMYFAMKLIEEKKGIGKSFFYMYFAMKLIEEKKQSLSL
jgi:DNA replication protein DnaC